MKMLINIIILTALICTISCQTFYKLTPKYWTMKKEFKKELELVQAILDYPSKIREIIESSEFYDKTIFDLYGHTYLEHINYLNSDQYGKAEIVYFGKSDIEIRENKKNNSFIKIKGAKVIEISKDDMDFSLIFEFIEINEKVFLSGISIVQK